MFGPKPLHTDDGSIIDTATMTVSQKIKAELPQSPNIPTSPGYTPEGIYVSTPQRHLHTHAYPGIIHNSQHIKENVLCVHNGALVIYSAILLFAVGKQTQLGIILLSKINQTQRKNSARSLIWLHRFKKQKTKQNKKTPNEQR